MAIDSDTLNVDLANPAAIRDRIPRIEGLVADKRQIAEEAQKDFETWDTLLAKLRLLGGLIVPIVDPDDPSVTEDEIKAAEDAVVRAVDRIGQKTRPVEVRDALRADGHDVKIATAVFTLLRSAAAAGRLVQSGPRIFEPLPKGFPSSQMKPVPEAHLGLSGAPPQGKAEAALRILGSAPNKPWSTQEVGTIMVRENWMADSESDFASLASTLSRLAADQRVFRPQRGQYQLAPPTEEGA